MSSSIVEQVEAFNNFADLSGSMEKACTMEIDHSITVVTKLGTRVDPDYFNSILDEFSQCINKFKDEAKVTFEEKGDTTGMYPVIKIMAENKIRMMHTYASDALGS